MKGDPRRSDRAYAEGNRDDVLRQQIQIGHSPEWIEVLQGHRPGILVPEGGCAPDRVKELRQRVLDDWGDLPPVARYDSEMRQYLSPTQSALLTSGQPIVISAFIERQLKLGPNPVNTSLRNRYQDSLKFGAAQTLHTIGRLLTIGENLAVNIEKKHAIPKALNWLFPHSSWPLKSNNDLYSKFEAIATEGDLTKTRQYFGDPESFFVLVLDEVRQAKATPEESAAALQFHSQVMQGLVACLGHDAENATAHRDLSRALQKKFRILDIFRWSFSGAARRPIEVVDLMSLALFDLPDADRVFQILGAQRIYFEAAAALGNLARGHLVRLEPEVSLLLSEVIRETPTISFDGGGTSKRMLPRAFLRYAIHRVGDFQWWLSALASPFAHKGVKYLQRGTDYRVSALRYDKKAAELSPRLTSNNAWKALRKLCKRLEFELILRPLPEGLLWHVSPEAGVAIVDFGAVCRFESREVERALEAGIEATAMIFVSGTHDGAMQTTNRLRPEYYRGNVVVATASKCVLDSLAPHRCREKEVELLYYSRFLTDQELEGYNFIGEWVGDQIRVALGLEPLGRWESDAQTRGGEFPQPRQRQRISKPIAKTRRRPGSPRRKR